MRWTVKLKNRDAAKPGLDWAERFFAEYDVAGVAWLRIDDGHPKYYGVYGRCHFPNKRQTKYRISCQLPGPFPCEIRTRRKPLYPQEDGTFAKAPRGCRRTTLCYDRRTKRKWYRVVGKTKLRSPAEGVVWIVGHESFHYLRATRQVPGRNTEIDADQFADDCLESFREEQEVNKPNVIALPLWQLVWKRLF